MTESRPDPRDALRAITLAVWWLPVAAWAQADLFFDDFESASAATSRSWQEQDKNPSLQMDSDPDRAKLGKWFHYLKDSTPPHDILGFLVAGLVVQALTFRGGQEGAEFFVDAVSVSSGPPAP